MPCPRVKGLLMLLLPARSSSSSLNAAQTGTAAVAAGRGGLLSRPTYCIMHQAQLCLHICEGGSGRETAAVATGGVRGWGPQQQLLLLLPQLLAHTIAFLGNSVEGGGLRRTAATTTHQAAP